MAFSVCGIVGIGFFGVRFLKSLTAARILIQEVDEVRMEEMKEDGANVCVKSD
ncbi:hypothetical protein [Oceanobacillus damuensis]|uniref:hypothetical protein n=1 Tax=Oceanobacillus damuensis TaxID=937928 RepID=UPI000AB16F1E|nr:hypothetical protein [Oceanobacillus damuensis]